MSARPSSLDAFAAADVGTLPALLMRRGELSPGGPALWRLRQDGSWRATPWSEYCIAMSRIAAALSRLGLAAGDRIGILARSSPEWDYVQLGVLAAGGVVVGLDPNDRDGNLDAIADRCELAGLVVQTPEWRTRLNRRVRERLRFVVSMQAAGESDVIDLDSLLEGHAQEPLPPHDVRPDDPATIVFTSGTTGTPKGIQYSHRQLCLAVASILDTFPGIGGDTRLACWLPLSNLFQRMINAAAIGCGAQTFYVEDPRTIMQHVAAIRPHVFIGVPRFYEKLYAGMMERIAQGPAWQRHAVAAALSTGMAHASALRAGCRSGIWKRAVHALAEAVVLRRLRSVMGPDLRFMVSGSAPMPLRLLEKYHAMGFLILEAYGMSENIVPIAMNRLDAYRFGTVGRVLRGNEVRLAEDGELWVRGPGVFGGYYGERGDRALDGGWLASGDYARIDEDGYVELTGRKSEIFKLSTGRRIAPAGIEASLREITYVEHVVVLGAGRPFPVVLLAVSENALRQAMSRQDLSECARIRADCAARLNLLPDYQRPAGFVVTTSSFGVESGELTPNLKLRRGEVVQQFRDVVEELYRLLASGAVTEVGVARDGSRLLLCSL